MSAYSTQVDAALAFVSSLHRHQTRKGSPVPYLTHLLGVAAIVGDCGGTETQVIAALLHDSIEDMIAHHPDIQTTIAERFGSDVLRIVMACSDTLTHPKPAWKVRKLSYIQHIIEADSEDPSLLVSLADKTYNGLTLLRDVRIHGPALWDRFKASPEDTCWYYVTLASAFEAKSWPHAAQRELAADYARLVVELSGVIQNL